MQELVKINKNKLAIKEFKRQRVVTFEDIDTLHERPQGTAGRNFRKNRNRFIENEDYFRLSGDELSNFVPTNFVASKTNRELILITESGYLMLVKSLNDDLAWEVQRQLVKTYFRAKEFLKQQQLNPEWQQARVQGIEVRKDETDAIKLLIEHAKTQGSTHADTLYITYSKLVKSLVGYDKRDTAPSDILVEIMLFERTLFGIITEEVVAGTFYKEIYQKAKRELMRLKLYWSRPLLQSV